MIGQNMFRTRLKQAYYYPQQQVEINRKPTNIVQLQTSTGVARVHHSLEQQKYSQSEQAQFEQSLRNQARMDQLRLQYTMAPPPAQIRNTKRVTWRDVHNVQTASLGNSLYTKPKATGCGCGAR